jgi:hypothetical protein
MERKISAFQYLIGYAALLVLVSLNLGLSYTDLPSGGLPLIALLSGGTVLIVVLVFMHLLEHASTVLVVVLVGLFFVVLLAALMMLDVVARAPEAPPAAVHDTMQEPG